MVLLKVRGRIFYTIGIILRAFVALCDKREKSRLAALRQIPAVQKKRRVSRQPLTRQNAKGILDAFFILRFLIKTNGKD